MLRDGDVFFALKKDPLRGRKKKNGGWGGSDLKKKGWIHAYTHTIPGSSIDMSKSLPLFWSFSEFRRKFYTQIRKIQVYKIQR